MKYFLKVLFLIITEKTSIEIQTCEKQVTYNYARLKIDLCRKFGIRRVNGNNKKLAFSSCSTQKIYQC